MTTVPQQAVHLTQEAFAALFRTARHLPADKYHWSPGGEARSPQSQIAECALTPLLVLSLLSDTPMDFVDPAARQRRDAMIAALDTLEAAEAAAQENYPKLYAHAETLTDADLARTVRVPLGGGRDMSVADLLFIAYQNLTYHTGQVNYIQLLLGDKEMH